jgi:hypothetical protein
MQRMLAPQKAKEVEERAKAEFATFTTKYPMWQNYREAMGEFMTENPGVTFETAFKAVAFEDALALGGRKVRQDLKVKKGANSQKPSSKEVKGKTPKKPTSIRDAFKLAKEMIGNK